MSSYTRPSSSLGIAGETVAARIRALQAGYLADHASARAQLAALRQAVSRSPGSDPAVWEATQLDYIPPSAGDDPTPDERAVHAALTLYAIHQQACHEPMYVPGQGLGRAAAALIGLREDENSAMRARFTALVTASSFTELCRHLRTFVSLLRREGIGLDYAALARDLYQFQCPGRRSDVLRRWAREMYYRPLSQRSSGEHATQPLTETTKES